MSNSELPIWLQYIQALGPTFASLAVGLGVVAISYWQWATARDRLRLDLFVKRFSIYVLFHDAVGAALSNSLDREEVFSRLVALQGSDKFIFGPGVSKSIAEVIDEIAHLTTSQNAVRQLAADDHPAEDKKVYQTKHENIQTRLLDRQENAFDFFKPYLSFARQRL